MGLEVSIILKNLYNQIQNMDSLPNPPYESPVSVSAKKEVTTSAYLWTVISLI